ncbi:MAG TPA: hypothetical protein GXX40_05625 [Firmicutes bacterium]|nr:hypothetical protein [Bacillota bacterium]
MRSVIEERGLAEYVLSLRGEGLSSREIAKRIEQEKGIRFAHTTVAKFLKAVREERRQITQDVVQRMLTPTVPADLEALERAKQMLLGWLDMDLKVREKLQVIDRLAKIIETRLKFAGAEPEENVTVKLYDFDDSAYPED